ncbi:DCD (development and cell death) domain protein [Medicago truncatula]|uniref:DCD (Development and cell death) domain protein n=1 Tax=Medicago truncatula TaxID=3880 RepID=A0A072V1A2_MEDTR|nr:DCD (development and cell death) domain protein [Medicago truncatula]
MDINNNNENSFWQFSDQLRHQTSNLASLSLNDSIWSTNMTKRPDQRRNFDVKNSDINNSFTNFNSKPSSDLNDGWKMMNNSNGPLFSMPHNNNSSFAGFNKGIYSSPYVNNLNNNTNNLSNINLNGYKSGFKVGDEFQLGNKGVKKNINNNNNINKKHGDNTDVAKTSADKKFKTLPPSESLPRNETIGGYIFVCNNDTMAENLKRQIFGLPPRYRDSVRTITPGLPLFLYNYSTHQLHGIFEVCIIFVHLCSTIIIGNRNQSSKGNNINIWWCLFRLQVLEEVILIQQLGRIRSALVNLVSLLRYNLQSNYYHRLICVYLPA